MAHLAQCKGSRTDLQTVGMDGVWAEFSRSEALGEAAPECFALLPLRIHECPKCPSSLTVPVPMPFVTWLFSPRHYSGGVDFTILDFGFIHVTHPD